MQTDTILLVSGGLVYDHDANVDRPTRADILIIGDRIAAVEPGLADRLGGPDRPAVNGRPVDEIIDASDRLIIPGLVNAHYHSHDVLLKGCFETVPRETWLLNALPPNYTRRSRAEIKARTLLGAVECLRAGITTVQDMLTLAPLDADDAAAAIEAYDEVGLRCVLALQTGDVPGAQVTPYWDSIFPPETFGSLNGVVTPGRQADAIIGALGEILETFGGRHRAITWGLAPSSPERASPAFLRAIAALSQRTSVPVFTHIYESRATTLIGRQKFGEWGGSLVRYLDAHGVLGPRTALAHGVWMRRDEIDQIAAAGSSVVLNPVGNLKTRSGIAPIRDYADAGINLGLGCDNCSCSDAQNMFQVMKAFATLPAVNAVDPGGPTARDSVVAATLGGARALGLDSTTGHIRPGAKADIVLLDLADPSFIPLNSAARQIVFTEAGRSVDIVIINGRIVVRNRRVITIDEAALRRDVEGLMTALHEEVAAVAAKTRALHPYLAEAHRRTWAVPLEIDRYVGQSGLDLPKRSGDPHRP